MKHTTIHITGASNILVARAVGAWLRSRGVAAVMPAGQPAAADLSPNLDLREFAILTRTLDVEGRTVRPDDNWDVIISIHGPAASGKSRLARAISAYLLSRKAAAGLADEGISPRIDPDAIADPLSDLTTQLYLEQK